MRILVILCVLTSMLAGNVALGQERISRLPPAVSAALSAAGISAGNIGVYVQDIDTAQPLLMVGADRSLDPASTMKLVTTYAALSLLGPAYTWKTEVYSDAPLHNGVLDGDLIIKGYGDPEFTVENLWLLLEELRQRGLREIHGNLLLDRSYFAPMPGNGVKFDDELARPYNTSPDALLVNFEAIGLTFIPDAAQQNLAILMSPALPQIKIINDVALDNDPCGDWTHRLKLAVSDNGAKAELFFSGNYSVACAEETRDYSVLDHSHYLYALFTLLWRELGGTFNGDVREGKASPRARLLASHISKSLSEIVHDTNKFSNNVMARQIFLTLTAVSSEGPPLAIDKSRRVVQRWLLQNHLTFPDLVIENGSGLSRNARISAGDLGRLLFDAFHSAVMPEFMASLPLVGKDGTMRKRLVAIPIAGQAHVKTGSLENVRAIAGYVRTAEGKRLIVVFLINDAHADGAEKAQDALLKWVYENPH